MADLNRAALILAFCVFFSSRNLSLKAQNSFPTGESGSGSGAILQTNTSLPVCADNEFLISNGVDLFCSTLPDPVCDCDDSGVTIASGDIPIVPIGCPILEPPQRGAFVCLSMAEFIYCSVYCDHRFEFSLAPQNPYQCGASTNFLWTDRSGQVDDLPQCTGYRHRPSPLYSDEFYLPAPCNGLSSHTKQVILEEFHDLVTKTADCTDCNLVDTFLHCPTILGTTQFFNEIKLRGDAFYRKKRRQLF